MAQRAIEFYMVNAEVVENAGENHGKAHRIHSCPQCAAAVALREDGLVLIHDHGEHIVEDLVGLSTIPSLEQESKSPDEGELITC